MFAIFIWQEPPNLKSLLYIDKKSTLNKFPLKFSFGVQTEDQGELYNSVDEAWMALLSWVCVRMYLELGNLYCAYINAAIH